MNITDKRNDATRLTIGRSEAIPLQVGAGLLIRCVEGSLWVTQEGDYRDYCLPAGTSYCFTRPGLVVVSSLDERSMVVASRRDPARAAAWRSGFSIHSTRALNGRSRAARNEQLREMVRDGMAAARRAWHWLADLVRAPLSS